MVNLRDTAENRKDPHSVVQLIAPPLANQNPPALVLPFSPPLAAFYLTGDAVVDVRLLALSVVANGESASYLAIGSDTVATPQWLRARDVCVEEGPALRIALERSRRCAHKRGEFSEETKAETRRQCLAAIRFLNDGRAHG